MSVRELGPIDEANFWAEKCADLERALSDEKQCARLNAECHTREIRALQDMVEAEAEARREAEGECERLKGELNRAIQLIGDVAAKGFGATVG